MRADRHRLALLTWVVVYPLITALAVLLEPLIAGLPVPVRTLALSALLVPTMVYVAMPQATARFSNWLQRSGA